MRRLTLCLPYYCNPGMLRVQLNRIAAQPQAVLDALEVIVVDDGSPDGEAQGQDIGCSLRIYRIGVDVRWNQDAARNVAAQHATGAWLLLTDIDHIVPRETFEALLTKRLDMDTVYRFSRMTWERERGADRLIPYKPHPNSWLMTRGMFEQIGGYDERFAGYYGTDADFRDRVLQTAPVVILKESLIRVPRETVPDASTTTYVRKQAGLDDIGIPKIKAARALEPGWRPLRLTFPYRQIYP